MESIFIGREEICRRLRQDVFCVKSGAFGRCYSLIGPNGIGKTTVIRHLVTEFRQSDIPNTYCFCTVLEYGTSFWDFWSVLIVKFASEISMDKLVAAPDYDEDTVDAILEAYDFFEGNLGKIEDDRTLKSRGITFLNELFENYTDIGIRIIITIDEFDRAKDIFKDGQFFQRLFGLTIKGAANLNLSIITISRRSVSTIAHHMQEGSNFQDAYPPVTLKGFSNAEMDQYFASYEQLDSGPLSKTTRQEIICLCGRNPGLLMSMRHEIELLGTSRFEISNIYSEHGEFIKTAYDRMCTLMNTEFVNQDKTVSSMAIFIQQFIGPVYMEKVSERLEKLYHYGFITKCGRTEENIFELSGLKEYRDVGKLTYEPMTPYFVDYVKDVIVPDDLHSLAGLLEKTEREIRRILCSALSEKYPGSWEEIVNQDIPKKDDYLDNLRRLAAQNDSAARKLTISKLNVLAFVDYYKIIMKHWDIMAKYFSLYKSQAALKSDMYVLNMSRNTSAHLNLEILNEPGRRGLREICEFILENIAKV